MIGNNMNQKVLSSNIHYCNQVFTLIRICNLLSTYVEISVIHMGWEVSLSFFMQSA